MKGFALTENNPFFHTQSNIDSILIFSHINTLICIALMRRIRYIKAFGMNVRTATLKWKRIKTRFCSNSWKTCVLIDVTSQNIVHSPVNCEWGSFIVATPFKVIRHTTYHQQLWFLKRIKLHRIGYNNSVDI
jgi:hypothetical protein